MDVFLIDAQDDPRFELTDDLQVEGFYELLDHRWPLASASQDVRVVEHQFVALAVPLLQGLKLADAAQLAVADDAYPVA